MSHALVDGNERLAWLATDVFLRINEIVVELPDDDVFGLVMAVADGRAEVSEIAEVLERAIAP